MRLSSLFASSLAFVAACAGPESTGTDATGQSDVDVVGPRPDVAPGTSPQFQGARVVSAYPARKQDGRWTRVCGEGQADGLITNVVYLSSARRSEGDALDLDVSIRPGDDIADGVVEGGLARDGKLSDIANVDLQVECVAPASQAACSGSATATLESSAYVANTPSRTTAHNILLLIDQSGSVSGLVQDDTWKEQRIPNPLPENFGQAASDQTSLRGATAQRLIRSLNASDQFGLIAFNEAIDRKVPCDDASGEFDEDLATCFGTGRDTWISGVNQLQSSTEGRSNLWRAVESAYGFLRSRNDTTRSNHIIVISDGPDTCAGENATSCESKCVTGDQAALLTRIEADANTPNAAPIHVHFIQFESVGYRGRDPRQVEAACTSGGHYQFIDSEALSASDFAGALENAVTNVRNALQGHWALAANLPAFAAAAPGDVYGIAGQLVLRASSNLVITDTSFGFGHATAPFVGWDSRLTVRKTCSGASDCGADGEGSCTVRCSPETLTCTYTTRPDLGACDGGFCCGGECRVAGACERCN